MVKKVGRGLRVYVAGPVNGSGRQHSNAHRAIEAAQRLEDAGFVPFVPHLTWLWAFMFPGRTEETILQWCKSWLQCCDIFLRLPGESPGSDFEEKVARELELPIYKVILPDDMDHMTPVRLLINAAKGWEYRDLEPGYRTPANPLPSEKATPPIDYLAFYHFQQEVAAWIGRQPFADQKPHQPLLGALEELGELAHAHLKNEQKIRGFDDQEKTRKAKLDAVGDALVYLAGYCECNDLSLREAIESTWEQVKRRDWEKNRMTGAARGALERAQPSPYSEPTHAVGDCMRPGTCIMCRTIGNAESDGS